MKREGYFINESGNDSGNYNVVNENEQEQSPVYSASEGDPPGGVPEYMKNRKDLWDEINRRKVNTNGMTFHEFSDKLDDKKGRRELYDNMQSEWDYGDDYKDFNNAMSRPTMNFGTSRFDVPQLPVSYYYDKDGNEIDHGREAEVKKAPQMEVENISRSVSEGGQVAPEGVAGGTVDNPITYEELGVEPPKQKSTWWQDFAQGYNNTWNEVFDNINKDNQQKRQSLQEGIEEDRENRQPDSTKEMEVYSPVKVYGGKGGNPEYMDARKELHEFMKGRYNVPEDFSEFNKMIDDPNMVGALYRQLGDNGFLGRGRDKSVGWDNWLRTYLSPMEYADVMKPGFTFDQKTYYQELFNDPQDYTKDFSQAFEPVKATERKLNPYSGEEDQTIKIKGFNRLLTDYENDGLMDRDMYDAVTRMSAEDQKAYLAMFDFFTHQVAVGSGMITAEGVNSGTGSGNNALRVLRKTLTDGILNGSDIYDVVGKLKDAGFVPSKEMQGLARIYADFPAIARAFKGKEYDTGDKTLSGMIVDKGYKLYGGEENAISKQIADMMSNAHGTYFDPTSYSRLRYDVKNFYRVLSQDPEMQQLVGEYLKNMANDIRIQNGSMDMSSLPSASGEGGSTESVTAGMSDEDAFALQAWGANYMRNEVLKRVVMSIATSDSEHQLEKLGGLGSAIVSGWNESLVGSLWNILNEAGLSDDQKEINAQLREQIASQAHSDNEWADFALGALQMTVMFAADTPFMEIGGGGFGKLAEMGLGGCEKRMVAKMVSQGVDKSVAQRVCRQYLIKHGWENVTRYSRAFGSLYGYEQTKSVYNSLYYGVPLDVIHPVIMGLSAITAQAGGALFNRGAGKLAIKEGNRWYTRAGKTSLYQAGSIVTEGVSFAIPDVVRIAMDNGYNPETIPDALWGSLKCIVGLKLTQPHHYGNLLHSTPPKASDLSKEARAELGRYGRGEDGVDSVEGGIARMFNGVSIKKDGSWGDMDKFFKNMDVSMKTKCELFEYITGNKIDMPPVMGIQREGNELRTYDGSGNLIERRYYESEGEVDQAEREYDKEIQKNMVVADEERMGGWIAGQIIDEAYDATGWDDATKKEYLYLCKLRQEDNIGKEDKARLEELDKEWEEAQKKARDAWKGDTPKSIRENVEDAYGLKVADVIGKNPATWTDKELEMMNTLHREMSAEPDKTQWYDDVFVAAAGAYAKGKAAGGSYDDAVAEFDEAQKALDDMFEDEWDEHALEKLAKMASESGDPEFKSTVRNYITAYNELAGIMDHNKSEVDTALDAARQEGRDAEFTPETIVGMETRIADAEKALVAALVEAGDSEPSALAMVEDMKRSDPEKVESYVANSMEGDMKAKAVAWLQARASYAEATDRKISQVEEDASKEFSGKFEGTDEVAGYGVENADGDMVVRVMTDEEGRLVAVRDTDDASDLVQVYDLATGEESVVKKDSLTEYGDMGYTEAENLVKGLRTEPMVKVLETASQMRNEELGMRNEEKAESAEKPAENAEPKAEEKPANESSETAPQGESETSANPTEEPSAIRNEEETLSAEEPVQSTEPVAEKKPVINDDDTINDYDDIEGAHRQVYEGLSKARADRYVQKKIDDIEKKLEKDLKGTLAEQIAQERALQKELDFWKAVQERENSASQLGIRNEELGIEEETAEPVAEETPAVEESAGAEGTGESEGAQGDSFAEAVEAARGGDTAAQERLNRYGIDWQKRPVVRFVSAGEAEHIMNGGRYEGRFGNGNVDVTDRMDGSTGASSEYRVVFKDELDWVTNNRLRMKNADLGDGWLTGGYSLDDVSRIEKRNADGSWETVYDADVAKAGDGEGLRFSEGGNSDESDVESNELENKKSETARRVDERLAELQRLKKEGQTSIQKGNSAEHTANNTAVSRVNGAQSNAPSATKVNKKLQSAKKMTEKMSNFVEKVKNDNTITANNFAEELIKELGTNKSLGQVSEYIHIDDNGDGTYTLRVSDHEGNARNIILKGTRTDRGYSIVLKTPNSPDAKFKANTWADVTEFVYDNPDHAKLINIAKSIFNLFDTGEYVDLAGADHLHSSPKDNSGNGIKFSLREEPAPKKTGTGYKVFVLKDGKLYPPMVANPNGEETPTGIWLNADAAPIAGTTKTGRNQVKAGGKGTQGGSGKLSYRPGWHLGEIPYALQFNRMNPENGLKELFPNNFVWAEVEYADDVDYNEDAKKYGINANGKYQHSLAGLPYIPKDGAYKYRTNPDPKTDPWIITGAMKVNRILTPSEVDAMVKDAGREPQKRQEGAVTDEQVEELNRKMFTPTSTNDMKAGVSETARNLGIEGDVELIEDKSLITDSDKGMERRKRGAYGWFDPKTGKVTIVLGNHTSADQAVKTLLHEAVAHRGLRELCGSNFNTFLDNIYNNVDEKIKAEIDATLGKYKDAREATEEWLARLAERTDFEKIRKSGLWQKIRSWFNEMLLKSGVKLNKPLTDEELRDLLVKSYDRMRKNAEGRSRRLRPLSEFNALDEARRNVEARRLEFMDGPVGDERTMMGVHNITEDKLKSALKLGGLANPSMAVIDTKNGMLTNFGGISLIPSSSLIEKQSGRNAGTFAADGYTPRFPETYRRLGRDGQKKLDKWLDGLGLSSDAKSAVKDQFNDYVNSFSIKDDALAYPFLHEKGLSGKVDYVLHSKVKPAFRGYVERFGGDKYDMLMAYMYNDPAFREEFSKAVLDDVLSDSLKDVRKEEGESFTDYARRRRELREGLRGVFTGDDGMITDELADSYISEQCANYNEDGRFDGYRTQQRAVDYIRDNGLRDEYQKYFDDKMKDFGAEMQVYAGRDSYGRSKFKTMTLEGVSQQMNKEGLAGAEGGIFGDSPGALRARMTPMLETLDQMRDEKGRLVSHEDFGEIGERFSDKMFDIKNRLFGGSFDDMQGVLMAKDMNAAAKRRGYDLSKEELQELKTFKDEILNMPTEYFETKFERPVTLDEFKAAVVPNNTSADVVQALKDAGLEVHEYDPNVETSREDVMRDVVEGRDDVLFREDDTEAEAEEANDAESQRLFDYAKERFGTTNDLREAGYILPDGIMLDFSGRHQVDGDGSFLNGRRTVDHREVANNLNYDENEEDTGFNTSMSDFIDRGAIRINVSSTGYSSINLNNKPTEAQRQVLGRLIRRSDGNVDVDFGNGDNSDYYAEYEGARDAGVLADINRYYDEGIKPGGNVLFSDGRIELNYETLKDKESRNYLHEVIEKEGWTPEAGAEFERMLDEVADVVMEMAERYPRMKDWQERKITSDEEGELYNPMWRITNKGVWTPNRSAFKKNGEYPWNLDLGTLCTKREGFDALVQVITEKGLAQNLGPTQIEAIKELLKDNGFLTACDICFNETKRANIVAFANQMSFNWKAVTDALGIGDGEMVGEERTLTPEQRSILNEMTGRNYRAAFEKYIPMEARREYEGGAANKNKDNNLDNGLTPAMMKRIAGLMKADPTLIGRLNPDTLISTRGIDWLLRRYGGHTKIGGLLASAWGAGTPKPIEGFNMYDPLSWRQQYDESKKRPSFKWFFDNGGFRAQSFTDYHPMMFLDYFQMFTDLAVRRLPIHIYTKVPSLIRLFGQTGAKINMSLVPEMVDGVSAEFAGLKPDGKGGWEYAWHEDSFPVDEAMELRKDPKYKGNIGTIAVGVSDRHIRMMLDDPNIDMVIPYHKSGMPRSVQIKTGLLKATDYTDYQNTGGKPKRVKDFSFNEAVNRLGDPRLAADEYLDWCDKNGYTPKFEQFRDHPNYYKLLEDFRLLDNEGRFSPQRAVRNELPENWVEELDNSLGDRTMQEGIEQKIRSNENLMQGIERLLGKQRLDGDLREIVVKNLKSALGSGNVVSLKQSEFFDMMEQMEAERIGAEEAKSKVEKLRRSDGVVYGFAVDGKIVLNENVFNAETPAHEFTHIWCKVARHIDPKLWEDGKAMMRETDEWKEVMSDELYKDIWDDEDAVASEVLSRVVAREFSDFVKETLSPESKPLKKTGIYKRIQEWFGRMFANVRSLFAPSARNLSWDELKRMPMRTLFDEAEAKRFLEAKQQMEKEGGMDSEMEMDTVEERDDIRFSDGDNAEVGPQSAEPSDNGGGGRDRGPRYNPRDLSKWNPLEHAMENVRKAREAMERAKAGLTAKREERDQGVKAVAGKDGLMNDESIPKPERTRLVADVIRKVSDMRKVVKDTRLSSEEKVKAITDTLIPMMANLSGMRRSAVERILRGINRTMSNSDVDFEVRKALDIVLDQYEKDAKTELDKLLKTKATRKTDKGLRVQGRVDARAAKVLKTFGDYRKMSAEALETRIGQLKNLLERPGTTSVRRAEAEAELEGLDMVKRYQEEVSVVDEERKSLEEDYRTAAERIYDFEEVEMTDNGGNVLKDANGEVRYMEKRILKPEFKGEMTEENKRIRRETEQLLSEIEDALTRNRLEGIEASFKFNDDMRGVVEGGNTRAKAFRDAQKERVDDILHDAFSDLSGVEARTDKETKTTAATKFKTFMYSPFRTFNSFLKLFGKRAPQGEGYMFNRFQRQWDDATDGEWAMNRDDRKELDEKANELAGVKKWDELSDLCKKYDKENPMEITYTEMGTGERVTEQLKTANALYIYAMEKQADGRMKLRGMGITEEDVEAISEQLPQELKDVVDWIQEDFLPRKRDAYNEVYRRMYGTDMANIENYFPILLNHNARHQEANVADPNRKSEQTATETGALKERTRNTIPLDIFRADPFKMTKMHIEEQNHWANFAELGRDLNDLNSSTTFRNKVRNFGKTRMGQGEQLWKDWLTACQIAVGSYNPDVNAYDKAAVKIASGYTAGKIGYRLFTAAKQLTSWPAFIPDSSAGALLKATVNAKGSWDWAMENIPMLEKRWKGRNVGDTRLDDQMALEFLKSNGFARGAMIPNAFVDALTCAIGAKAVYDTKYKYYTKVLELPEDKAHKLAVQDAEHSFNSSQQSSEGAFVSDLQKSRTWFSVAVTTFRNGPMGYGRRLADAFGDLKQNWSYSKNVPFRTQQLIRMGVDPDRAEKIAKKEYRNGRKKDLIATAIFGYVLGTIWNWAGNMTYHLFGDDDERDDALNKEELLHGIAAPIEGLVFGQNISSIFDTFINNKDFLDTQIAENVALSDIENFAKQWKIGFDKGNFVPAFASTAQILSQGLTGVDVKTYTNMLTAIYDCVTGIQDGDNETANELALATLRLINAPRSSTEEVFLDDIKNGRPLDYNKYKRWCDRYVRYKKIEDGMFLYSVLDDPDVTEKYEEKYVQKLKDRSKMSNFFTSMVSEMEFRKGKEKDGKDVFAKNAPTSTIQGYMELQNTLKPLNAKLKERPKKTDDEDAFDDWNLEHEDLVEEQKRLNAIKEDIDDYIKEMQKEPDMLDDYLEEIDILLEDI